MRYYGAAIRSFRDADTRLLYKTGKSRRIPANIRRAALRKLVALHNVDELEQLRMPPGNHLEALGGDRKGQHSIRINDRYRLCFVWRDGDAYNVEVVDCH